MNQHLYRVIFNKHRGELVVVAENVSMGGSNGTGSGAIDDSTEDAMAAKRNGAVPLAIVSLLHAIFGIAALFPMPVYAQIVADPNAPGKQRPTVLQTANGVVQVNIQTPSAAGISRNSYSQFDVTRNNAVLNNSRTQVQSQVGGWVQGNPWLSQGSARVILNEVSSPNPSQLRGYLEVAGQRAEIVIANPSGIDVDGAGFINASRVTLTTGVPRMRDGVLEDILVQQGRVTVNGQGLDATQVDYAAILARAVQVNANIWAKQLEVITGANRIDATSSVSTQDDGSTRPNYALDVAQLGGMYAGQITLIGTEAGVGVKNAGAIEASSGSITLSANGWLTNSGTIVAPTPKARVDINAAGGIDNKGQLYSGGDVKVESLGDIVSTGLIGAQNNVSVAAVGTTSRIDAQANAVFASGLRGDGTLLKAGNLSLTAENVSNHGTMISGANMEVNGGALDLSRSTLIGEEIELVARVGNIDAHGSEITAKDVLALTAAQSIRTDDATVGAKQARLEARDWSNVGGQLLLSGSGDTDISLSAPGGMIDNTAGRIAANGGNLRLGAGTLVNTDGMIEHAGTGTLAIRAATVDDQRGQITGNGTLDIATGAFDHRDASTAARGISIAAHTLNNQGGRIAQLGTGAATIMVSGTLANGTGKIESNGDTRISVGGLDNSSGRITAIGSATVDGGSGLNNADGLIAAGQHLAVHGGDVDNTRGTLQAQGGDAALNVGKLINAGGSIYAAGRLDTTAAAVANSGSMYAGGDQHLVVSSALANSGVIAAQGNTVVTARSLDSAVGSLLGAGVKADGSLGATGDLSVTTTSSVAAHGQNLAAGQVSLAGAAVDVTGSQTGGTGVALHATGGDVITSGATVATAGTLAIHADGHDLVNRSGTLSGGQLDLLLANLENHKGELVQSGTGDTRIVLSSPNSVLDNTQGRIAVNGANLAIEAGTLTNTDGRIEHAGSGTLSVAASTFNGVRGSMASNGAVALAADVLIHDGATTSGRDLSVQAGALSNREGHLLQGGAGELTLQVAGLLDNTAGQIAADGKVAVDAGVLANKAGSIGTADSARVTSLGALDNTGGTLTAARSLVVMGGAIDNTRGAIQAADGILALDAASLLNSSGVVSAGTDLNARVTGELRNDAVIYAGRNQALALGGALINTGSIAARGNTRIHAGSIDSGAASLLGAGIRSDGSLAQDGALTVTAAQALVATGQNLAAGDVLLAGAAIDLHGGATSGANIVLSASGNVNTSHANVGTVGTLAVAANTLDNAHGTSSAGQLALHVANLDNNHGTLIQTGAGDTDITLSAPGGRLDNTAGRIAANSGNLTMGAGTLVNTDGSIEHAGSGTLAIRAGIVADQRGQIIGNGALDLTAGAIDHRDANTSAQQIRIAATSLDNSAGQIASNGDATFNSVTLDNSGGRIAAIGSATIAGNLNNTDGLVAAGLHLAVHGGDVDNTRGTLQAQGGDAALNVGSLTNAGGSIYAAGRLDTTAASIANSGNLYAGGDQHLVVSGALANSGVIAAQGNTAVTAGNLDSAAGSLLGAGVKADGSLGATGDLSVTTTSRLAAHGQNVAAGQVSLAGAAVDVTGSQTGGTGVALHATGGDVITSGATVATAGTLAIHADGHDLVNRSGTLSGGQLDLLLAKLDNHKGELVQSGTGDTRIMLSSPNSVLDNNQGRIAVNGANLVIGAGTLTNTDGRIEHAGSGTLSVAASTFNGVRGSMASNGAVALAADVLIHDGATTSGRDLSVQAGALSNREGHLLQGGAGELTLQVAGLLDNTAGQIAADGKVAVDAGALANKAGSIGTADSARVTSVGALDNTDGTMTAAHSLAVTGGAIDNTRGAIQAAGGALALDAASLLNSAGVVSAGTDLNARVTGELRNDAVIYAGRNQALALGGALINTGSIAARGNTRIHAGSIDSGAASLLGAGIRSDGSLAQDGALTVTAAQALVATGQNLAAGDVLLAGAAIDLHGGATSGANIVLSASGNVNTSHANVGTAGTLAVAADTLDNAHGTLSAGQLALQVANLDNNHGTLIQTGAGDTDITLSAPGGRLDNTAGRIAANSGNLTMGAGTLVNTDGSIGHAGSGTLAIRAGTVAGQRGQIIGNGALDLTAGAIDHRDANTSAQQIRIAATSLDNSAGQIASNGDATFNTATLDNSGGRIAAIGSATVAGNLSNTDGLFAAGLHLAVHGGDLDNTRGTLQAQGGDAALNVGNLTNAGGSIYAAGRLDTTAASIANSGNLYAGGDQHLAVTGGLVNSGVIAAHGNNSVTAGSVDSATGSLLGAGLKADGSLRATGDLSVTTTNGLAAHGQNLAAGQVSLAGAAVDVSGSQTGGTRVALHATGGDVITNGATVATAGTLAIHADGHDLVNRGGTLSGGQLDLLLANLDNRHGELVQSGSGDTRIVLNLPNGVLDNTQGRIAVNGVNLTIGAGTLTNTSGQIGHAGVGVLEISASTLGSQDGEIIGNGQLHINTDNFDNRSARTVANQISIATNWLDNTQGSIVQKGSGSADITVLSALNNQGGTIASNGDTTINAGMLDNQAGTLMTAAAGRLALAVSGALDNRNGGTIAAANSASIQGQSILNQTGRIVAGDALVLGAAMKIQNDQGVIAANGTVQVTAGELNNDGGKLASVDGDVRVATNGLTKNDSGVIQASGDVVLTNGGISNTQMAGAAAGGSIVGRSININTAGTAFNNQLGTVAATQDLSILSGALWNAGGLVQSGGALRLDTAGQALDNSNAGAYSLLHPGTSGGIVSGGNVNLNVGTWNNAAGFFGTGGGAMVQAGNITNTAAGQMAGAASLNISANGLNNQGGQVQALGDISLALAGGILDNQYALIRSGGTLNVAANAVDNRGTQGYDQGMEGQNVVLSALAINNSQGAIRADMDAQLHSSGTLKNSQGLISAGKGLTVADDSPGLQLAIDNTGGTLIGGTAVNVRAAAMNGEGHLLSLGDLTLELNQDYVNAHGNDVQAARDARFVLHGDFSNYGKLSVGGALSVEARNIDNTADGEISATTTRVTATDNLRNRGLIDGNDSEINAGVLDNAGSGRIYGGHLSIEARVLNNDVENGVAGSIAARQRLDVGVQDSLNNREHALLFSGGDMAIGGALGANRLAVGQAGSVTNASATIEALGDLSLTAGTVNNLNNHFTVGMRTESVETVTEYQGNKSQGIYYPSPRYAAGTPGVLTYYDYSLHLQTPAGYGNWEGDYDDFTEYKFTRTTQRAFIASSDPGRIASGGNLSIFADNVHNDNSQILSGGSLSILGTQTNDATQGQKITSKNGFARNISPFQGGALAMAIKRAEVAAGAADAGTNYGDPTVYAPTDVIETIFLNDSLVKEYAFSDGSATVAAMAVAGGNLTGATSAARAAQVDVKTRTIVKVVTAIDSNAAATGDDAGTVSSANLSSGGAIDGAATQAVALGAVAGPVASAQGLATSTAGRIEVRTGSVGVDGNEVSQALGAGGQSQSTQAITNPVDAGSGSLGAAVAVSAQQAAATANLLAPASPNVGHSATGTVGAAEAASSAANAQAPGIAQVALSHSGGAAHSVRTMTPSLKLPVASLFQIQSSSSSSYLVETDPRFTNYRQWLGSDYMLDQLALDPAVTQKRLGDGYYEQSLVREQVTQLTSQRFLADYTSDDDQYRGLMDAGIAFAKEWNLRPGVALSAEQMAGLTKDMVWLVMQDVTLADGSVQKVLTPQVYLASEGNGTASPALLSGRDVAVTSAGNIDNTGTIVARNTMQLVADNVNNLGGRIQGNSVLINAQTDINNIGGTISAGQELIAVAGRDIKVETTTRSASSAAGANQFGRTTIDQVGSLMVTGDGASLLVSAGRDLNIVGGQIDNRGVQGTTFLGAGRDINLGTVTTASREALSWDANNFHKESASTDVGSQVHGAGAVTLKAGADLNLRAANVEAGTALVAIAGNNVHLLAGTATSSLDDGHVRMEKSFLHKETITTRDTVNRTSGVGSVFSGQTVDVQAGHDLTVSGSAIVGDGDVNLIAGNAVSITAATSQNSENHYRSVKESGFLSGGGGFGISYGTRTTTTDQSQEATVQSGQARSTVGSIGGNLNVSAGDALAISGSDLSAGKDMNLAGRSVAITAGADDVNSKFTSKMTQDAFTLAIGGSVVNAIQTADSMGAAAGQTSSGRLKALAAASAVLTVKDAAQDLAKNGPSAKISLTVGHSESESTEVTASRTHGGSVLAAGSDVNISATGGGKASNIDIVGSDVRAAGKVSLAADNQVNLLAAQDSESQHSQSKSWSAAVGVAAELSASSKFGYTASVTASRGNVDGEGATQVNSHVSAGDRLTISSGGDTNLKGAVASGSQVVADVKGNLNIQSLQDTATLDGKRQSVSVSGTVGAGAGFSANLSQSKVHNDYASVQEQSGIRAGDGGFQLQVAGNTDLKGGVISSSEQAINDGRNSLAAATLSVSDIQNRDSHDASGVSLGVNVGKNQKGDTFSPTAAPGIGQASGSQASVTRSGVSGAALTVSDQQAGQAAANLNRDVSNGKDVAQALTKGWNGAQALDEVGAQMKITSSAMPRLAQKIGDYAEAKVMELNKQGNAEEAAKWVEGGIYRVAAHTALGAMGGGLGGAVGGAVSAEAAPTLSKLETAVKGKLAEAGLGSDAANVAAKLIAGGAAAAIGGVAGRSLGAATGLNSEANNRQLHSAETTWIKKNATKFAEERGISVEEATKRLAQQASKDVDLVWRGALPDNEDKDAKAFLARAQGEGFTNSFGQKQELFSTQDGQFTAAQNGLFESDKAFVNKYVTPYANRTALEGVRAEIGQMANEVLDTVKRDPLGVAKQAGISILTGAWETISHPVSAANVLIDSTVSSAKTFGEGVASSTSEDVQRQLNSLYGQDVTSAIQIATTAQGALLLGSALGAGKAAGKAVTAVGDAVKPSSIKIKSFLGRGDAGGTAVDPTISLHKAATGSYRNPIVGDDPYSPSELLAGGIDRGAKAAAEKETLATFAGNTSNRTYRDLDLTINERGLLAQERSLAESAGWKRADGSTWWPPYDGALPGTTKIVSLDPGSGGALNLVDRFGRTSGSYVSPAGLSLEARALSSTPLNAPSIYSIDATIIGVERATVAPWFGQKGLGVQFKLPDSVQFYLDTMQLGVRK